MELICTQCHATVQQGSEHCPACAGKLMVRPQMAEENPLPGPKQECDHRGILLPRRHALGGVITPQ